MLLLRFPGAMLLWFLMIVGFFSCGFTHIDLAKGVPPVTTDDHLDPEKFRDFLYCAGRVTDFGPKCEWDVDCIFAEVHQHRRFGGVERECLTQKTYRFDFQKFESLVHQRSCGPALDSNGKKKKIWMALSVRNCIDDLLLFIIYHSLIGVQHFVVYDEMSTDGTKEALAGLIEHGWVTYERTATKQQRYSIGKAVAKGKELGVDWIGFLDVDEYFYSSNYKCLSDFLANFEDDKTSSVLVNWMFMPGSLDLIDPHNSTLFSLSKFCPKGDAVKVSKSFVRPFATAEKTPETPHLMRPGLHGYTPVFSDGKKQMVVSASHTNTSTFILHYRFKSFTKWVEKSHKGTGATSRPSHDFTKVNIDLLGRGVFAIGGMQCHQTKTEGKTALKRWLERVHQWFWEVVEMEEAYVGLRGLIEYD